MGLKPLNAILVATGLVLVSLNLALGSFATSQVPAAVEEAVAMKVKDDICKNTLCTEVNEEWLESTSQRDFFAWHITNLDDVVENNSAPEYERIGPVTYDVTLKKEVDNYDIKNGLLTYKQLTSYSCSEDTLVPCSTEVSQLNIAFTPQVVGATGTAINAVMEITKTGFSSNVIGTYLQKVSAAHGVADEIKYDHMVNLAAVEGPGSLYIVDTEMHNTAESYFLDEMFAAFNDAYGDVFLEDDTKTYLGEGGVDPRWVDGIWDDDGDGILEPDEDWYFNETGVRIGDLNNNGKIDNESSSFVSTLDLEYPFYEAVGPNGENFSLVNYMGPLVYAAMGEPESLEFIQQNPEDSITLQRAEIWGFEHPTDLNITLARDWTLFGGMGKLMKDYGALNDDFLTDYSEDDVNLSSRVQRLFGIEMDDDVASKVFGLGDGTDQPMGILAESDSGLSFGLSEFLDMDMQTAMETYGITSSQHQILKDYCSSWINNEFTLPLILVGGEGNISASQFVNQTFGSANPIDDSYLEYSLNIGGMWGTGTFGFPAADPIDLTQEQSAKMLYGPWGLTTAKGANMFLYGELSGKTLPINYTTEEREEAKNWTNETVAEIYGIDAEAAGAAKLLMMEVVFSDFVPEYLIDSFETSQYLTQPVNNWLLGWHDPVNAYLATGDSENMTEGWTSLESNETYFGSDLYVDGGISTGDPAKITICTGEVDSCDKGETVQVGDSKYVGWRTMEKEDATYGLITAEMQGETTGGFITGEGDLIDLSGYGTADVICSKESTLKGIPVDVCTAEMDPLTRPIQAKLINNGDLLDAIPGALPVYFGSNVEIKVEQLSGAIIGGQSESTFWLDMRDMDDQKTPPATEDLQEVFVIKTSAELDDETAETMESQIVTNQDFFAYFTNFDHWVDYVTLCLWIGGLGSLLAGAILIFKGDEDGFADTKWIEEGANSTPIDESTLSENDSESE
tara:strand:- start:2629 stop:5517 length:2889 start_codon:yes stop_codon:yes gene_type:complete